MRAADLPEEPTKQNEGEEQRRGGKAQQVTGQNRAQRTETRQICTSSDQIEGRHVGRWLWDGESNNVCERTQQWRMEDEPQSRIDWQRVVTFGKLAEHTRTLAKGSYAMVQGAVSTREFEVTQFPTGSQKCVLTAWETRSRRARDRWDRDPELQRIDRLRTSRCHTAKSNNSQTSTSVVTTSHP